MSSNWPIISRIHTVVFDFDGVFTNNKVFVNEDGIESVQCDRADGLGINMLKRAAKKARKDVELLILSTEANKVVTSRSQKLDIQCHQNVSDKCDFLTKYLKGRFPDWKSPWEGLVYLGNDLNDLEVILKAGFSFVPADAHTRVKSAANAVGESVGGHGFVREFVEKILALQSMNLGDLYELVSDR